MNEPDQLTSWTAQTMADHVAGTLLGPADLPIVSMEALDRAEPNQLTFISNERYAKQWLKSRSCVALIPDGLAVEEAEGRALITVPDVDLAVAKVLELMAPPAVEVDAGVHASAVVDPSAQVDNTARIGPNCYIGRRAVVGPNVVLHANVTVMDDVRLGADCVLWPGVVIRERCTIGERCVLHPNVSVGADGFGYRPGPDGTTIVKIPQIGTVTIGADVEIGSGTCIDRAKFGTTEIGAMSKLDNLVQIGHNCRVGERVIIAGKAGLAGSVTVGDDAVIGGAAILRDHVTIGPAAKIAGFAGVMSDVPSGATWAGYPAQDAKIALREQAALRKLPELARSLRKRQTP
ncbi:MAG: UDP-3-O-(3-hydroxymyristoyl)glucosamine N-acyltransferase [Phycisphaeraceae bacterium]